jgi:hypothetical protein
VDKLGKILPTVVARQPRSAVFVEVRLRLALAAVLGEELAAGCQAIEVRKSTVWITTHNPDLAHQLRSEREHLIRRLNQETHLRQPVRRLQVEVGPRPDHSPRR